MELAKKVIGWILFFAGIAVIGYGLYSSFNIFTAKTAVPEIFKAARKDVPVPAQSKTGAPQDLSAQAEQMMNKAIGEQLGNILPADFMPKLFNLISWSIFAGILIFGGVQVSGLGIKLMKG